jgi:RNA polymerase sigma-70 factor (ECF subfamily)
MPTIDQLTTELAWIRGLARALVKDVASSDDIAQDAWLAASDKLPEDRPLRPWLSRVVLNLVRMRTRSARRRAGYESAAPSHDPPLRPDELVGRLEMQRKLVEAVLGLDELHRSVVLLHYFEGLNSVEIGRLLGIPDVTVRRRLQTAIARLRTRLDEDARGDRRAWVPLVASLAGPREPTGMAWRKAAQVASIMAVGALIVSVWLGRRGHDRAWTTSPVAVHTSSREAAPPAGPVSGDAHRPAAPPVAGCAWRTFGAVSDAHGIAIPAATVRVDSVARTETDGAGRYELCRPPGSVLVTVSADGYGSVSAEVGVSGAVHRDFVLAPEAVISGQVVAPGTDMPVSDARVIASAAENPPAGARFGHAIPPQITQTSETGRFQIGGLAPGRYRIIATAGTWRSHPVERFVDAGGARALVIHMANRTPLSGRVAHHGAAVAGTLVTASSRVDPTGTISTRTDAEGAFVMDSPPDSEVTWVVRGYELRAPPTTQRGQVVLDVVPASSIHGRVTMRGSPVADAGVECDRPDWSHGFDWVIQHVRSDSDGRYTIDNAAPGECMLEVTSAGLGAASEPRRILAVAGARTLADVELTRSARVSGVVLDQSGAPVGFAHVRLESDDSAGEAMTDEAGAFTIRGLREGATYLPSVGVSPSASHRFPGAQGHALPAIHVSTPAIDGIRLNIRDDRGALSGRVIDEQGVAVSDARIQIEYGTSRYDALPRGPMVIRPVPAPSIPNSGLLGIEASTMTDSAGRFVLDRVVAGRYGLRAEGPDGATSEQYELATGTEITLVLPRAGAIEGTLTGFAAAPTVIVTDHGYRVRTVIAERGRFRVDGLSPGAYAVIAQDRVGGASVSVQVRSGVREVVELNSRGMGTIEGRVVALRTGAPVAAARCAAAPAADGFASWWTAGVTAETDESGRFRLDPVPAGPVHVECWAATWVRVQRAAVVRAGATPTQVSLTTAARHDPAANPGFGMLNEQLPPPRRSSSDAPHPAENVSRAISHSGFARRWLASRVRPSATCRASSPV